MYAQGVAVCLAVVGCAQAQSGTRYGGNILEVIRDSDTVAAAFPPIDVELRSPYFLNPERANAGFANGTAGATSLTDLDNFVRSIVDRNDWITYQLSNFTTEEGRRLPYVFLSGPSSTSANKVKVYIQAAIHGDEPGADEGALALLGKMDANQTWTASLLEKMDILMLVSTPRWNADGVAYFQREMASNLDPNRDAVKLDRQQTRDIWRRAHEFAPHVMADLHEHRAFDNYGEGEEYRLAQDVMLGIATDLKIHPAIRKQALEVFVPNIEKRVESYGLRCDLYAIGPGNMTPPALEQPKSDARYAEGAIGLTQAIAFFFEGRGIGLADQHFQRRVASQLLSLGALLETVRDDDTLYDVIENARAEFISSTEDIVITDASVTINRTFPFISRENGSVVELPVSFQQTPSLANLTRSRPEAYLIPHAWSDIVERLKIFGLEVETLDYEYRGTVEALTIASSTLDTFILNGHVLNTVTTTSAMKEVNLPVGSFLVSTRQKNAALAFAVLEPEGVDSYVTFNFIPLYVGDEYPIFRVMA